MRTRIKSFLLIIFVLGLSLPAISQRYSSTTVNAEWEFREKGSQQWLPAKVPGSIFTDLIKAGKISDPFLGTNEKDVQWVSEKDWEYQGSFELSEALLKSPHIDLIFKGLDTYAKVSVNGKEVLDADNMFRSWRIEAKSLLKPGKNLIEILFESPLKKGEAAMEAFGMKLPGSEPADTQTAMFSRKAHYQYGWDWGPGLPGAGIWRPVEIEFRDQLSILDFRLIQKEVNTFFAECEAVIIIESDLEGPGKFHISDGRKEYSGNKIDLKKGVQVIRYKFRIDRPTLWWPNGMGNPHVYNFKAVLSYKGEQGPSISTSKFFKTGIRSVRLINEEDESGTSFYFEINDRPVFAKGANIIPTDIYPHRQNPEKETELVEQAKALNMNMLRVWGGGIYPSEAFFQACDENGIMVWQDFMFAGAMYPGNDVFLENVREEAIEQVGRIGNHASVVAWCGNNEIEVAWNNWGWQSKFNNGEKAKLESHYNALFKNLLPSIVDSLFPFSPYVHTSPLSNWGKEENFKHHNMHYWGVWHGEDDFSGFQKNVPRFMTEYGMQSFPSMNTVRKYAKEDQLHLDSDVIQWHQKSYKKNVTLSRHIGDWFKVPEDLGEYVYASQLAQSKALEMGITAHRMAQPFCMGSLFWQFNDCWPGPSWSVIDYYGNQKAAWNRIQQLYAPITLLSQVSEDSINIYLISEINAVMSGDMTLQVMDFEGKTLFEKTQKVRAQKPGISPVFQTSVKKLIGRFEKESCFVKISFDTYGGPQETVKFFVPENKLLLPPPTFKIETTEKGEVKISTEKFLGRVFLEVEGEAGKFDQNWIDLMPGTSTTFQFNRQNVSGFSDKIRVYSLNSLLAD